MWSCELGRGLAVSCELGRWLQRSCELGRGPGLCGLSQSRSQHRCCDHRLPVSVDACYTLKLAAIAVAVAEPRRSDSIFDASAEEAGCREWSLIVYATVLFQNSLHLEFGPAILGG